MIQSFVSENLQAMNLNAIDIEGSNKQWIKQDWWTEKYFYFTSVHQRDEKETRKQNM